MERRSAFSGTASYFVSRRPGTARCSTLWTNRGVEFCHCYLVQGSDGLIYGTAQGGGATGAGAIFSLDVGLPKPAPRTQHFSPASGAVGSQVRLWGQDLLPASVEFNGFAATNGIQQRIELCLGDALQWGNICPLANPAELEPNRAGTARYSLGRSCFYNRVTLGSPRISCHGTKKKDRPGGPSHLLLVPQRLDRIDARRAAAGNQA
jgi:uncharacterized repeat protein (TIGR03803 family)